MRKYLQRADSRWPWNLRPLPTVLLAVLLLAIGVPLGMLAFGGNGKANANTAAVGTDPMRTCSSMTSDSVKLSTCVRHLRASLATATPGQAALAVDTCARTTSNTVDVADCVDETIVGIQPLDPQVAGVIVHGCATDTSDSRSLSTCIRRLSFSLRGAPIQTASSFIDTCNQASSDPRNLEECVGQLAA